MTSEQANTKKEVPVAHPVEVAPQARPAAAACPSQPRHSQPTGDRPAELVPISALILSDSPRLAGESTEHSRTLAASEAALPPITVHRATMRVLDGIHRVKAARLRGESRIPAVYFDGDEKDAFVLAVRANIAHGLPLSLTDRTAAAARILTSHPQWSDRAIASATGLSHKTIAAIRRRTGGDAQLPCRAGLDGRTRPLTTAEGREAAAALIAKKPTSSLREIARATGISLGTAHDVSTRLQRGEDPVLPNDRDDRAPRSKTAHAAAHHREPPTRDSASQATAQAQPHPVVERDGPPPAPDCREVMERLCRDPSLRLSEQGRTLLRLLARNTMDAQTLMRLTDTVPAHWTATVADMARDYANSWSRFAEQLEETTPRQP